MPGDVQINAESLAELVMRGLDVIDADGTREEIGHGLLVPPMHVAPAAPLRFDRGTQQRVGVGGREHREQSPHIALVRSEQLVGEQYSVGVHGLIELTFEGDDVARLYLLPAADESAKTEQPVKAGGELSEDLQAPR